MQATDHAFHRVSGEGIADDAVQIAPTPFIEITRRPDRKMETHLGMNDLDPSCWVRFARFRNIVRHAAKAFKVEDDEIWEWIDRERHNPTTGIREVKPN